MAIIFNIDSRQCASVATTFLGEACKDNRGIFNRWTFQPVRLIGMTAERLSRGETQAPLFTDPAHERQRSLDDMADRINERFGKQTIKRGGSK